MLFSPLCTWTSGTGWNWTQAAAAVSVSAVLSACVPQRVRLGAGETGDSALVYCRVGRRESVGRSGGTCGCARSEVQPAISMKSTKEEPPSCMPQLIKRHSTLAHTHTQHKHTPPTLKNLQLQLHKNLNGCAVMHQGEASVRWWEERCAVVYCLKKEGGQPAQLLVLLWGSWRAPVHTIAVRLGVCGLVAVVDVAQG